MIVIYDSDILDIIKRMVEVNIEFIINLIQQIKQLGKNVFSSRKTLNENDFGTSRKENAIHKSLCFYAQAFVND